MTSSERAPPCRRHVALEGGGPPGAVAAHDHQAVVVHAGEQVVEGHREAELAEGAALRRGDRQQLVPQARGQVALPMELGGQAGRRRAVHGLADVAHPAAGQAEAGHVDDGLVADVEGAEPGPLVDPDVVVAGADDRGTPAVAVAERHERPHRGVERGRIAHGSPAARPTPRT
jgi:hypothetical protein